LAGRLGSDWDSGFAGAVGGGDGSRGKLYTRVAFLQAGDFHFWHGNTPNVAQHRDDVDGGGELFLGEIGGSGLDGYPPIVPIRVAGGLEKAASEGPVSLPVASEGVRGLGSELEQDLLVAVLIDTGKVSVPSPREPFLADWATFSLARGGAIPIVVGWRAAQVIARDDSDERLGRRRA